MPNFQKLILAGVTALSMALASTGAPAQSSGKGGGNNGGTSSTDSSPPTGGGGSKVWSHRGSANGVILCATRECMGSETAAMVVTHSPNYPRRRYGRERIVQTPPAENCSKTRYVYPNGTVIIQSTCPRAVLGHTTSYR